MANYFTYKNDSGLILTQTSTLLEDVQYEWQQALGTDLSLEPGTPQGRMIEAITTARKFAIGLAAETANQINPNYASGIFLDAIAALFGIKRLAATRTSVLATLTGVANTTIQAGALARTTVGDEFYLERQTTIPSSGIVQATFLSVNTGPVPCAQNTLTQMVTQVEGWESINNSSGARLGEDVESDYNLRRRIENSSRYQGVSLIGDIKRGINDVANVTSSYVFNNGTGETVNHQGVDVLEHSVLILVEGGQDDAIAQAIFENLSAGCNMTPIEGQSVIVNVRDGSYGIEYPITFNRPAPIDIIVQISVRNNGYSGDDLERAVKDAIVNWSIGNVDGLDAVGIGDSISAFNISSIVQVQIPTIIVSDVKIARQGDTPTSNELGFKISEVGRFTNANITVLIDPPDPS